jgi:hypothetical protein
MIVHAVPVDQDAYYTQDIKWIKFISIFVIFGYENKKYLYREI